MRNDWHFLSSRYVAKIIRDWQLTGIEAPCSKLQGIFDCKELAIL
jgi:hypothetical protein